MHLVTEQVGGSSSSVKAYWIIDTVLDPDCSLYNPVAMMVDCIILLSDLVRPWVFQLAVKLGKIFEQKCKSNGKFKQILQWPTQEDQM